MKYDYLIVGVGLYGSVKARTLTDQGQKCLVIDRRDHVGGNCYTRNIEGINVHEYMRGVIGGLGIAKTPVIADYNEPLKNEDRLHSQYAFFYGKDGEIFDHRREDLGVEQWYVRKSGCYFIVDLISIERIVPVKRLKFPFSCK